MSQIIWHIAIPSPIRNIFDYLPPVEFAELGTPGARVRVSFGKRTQIGIIHEIDSKTNLSHSQLKPVLELIDKQALLNEKIRHLIRFASRYYHQPIGEVYKSALPALLREGKDVLSGDDTEIENKAFSETPEVRLNSEQKLAVDTVSKFYGFKTYLLQGITGSGKTEVYIEVIKHQVNQGKQCLVLIPEISLTPQTFARFSRAIKQPITQFHSNLTNKQRLINWELARSGKAAVILGTRSAVFTPLKKPGLIIIDEEHDMSFKQQERFRYHARDLAIFRAQIENIPIILGSATPSFETIYNTNIKKYEKLKLTKRAGAASTPKLKIIDIRQQKLDFGLSTVALSSIKEHLAQDNQVLIYLNRRGFAPAIYCKQCSWLATCRRCDAKMTYHQQYKQLICHLCDNRKLLPNRCPSCNQESLIPLGSGTERLEESLGKLFDNVELIRIDSDSTKKKNSLEVALNKIKNGKKQILIGTQMLTKGHDFPNLSLVIIVDADSGLLSPDFFTTERLGQTLIQVAGRAGRLDKLGEVLIQTQFPTHPLLQLLVKSGYEAYADSALVEREATSIPPYSAFAILRAQSTNPDKPIEFLQSVKSNAVSITPRNIQILGPIPAILAKRANFFRAQLLIQTPDKFTRERFLTPLLAQIEKNQLKNKVRWSLDIDPKEMY